MDIGFVNEETELDYPFLNGSHHLYVDTILSLKRQDPFNDYNYRTESKVSDINGKKMKDKYKINKSGDVC